jgi:uncharacterized protein (TIGR02594 family)
MDRLALPTQYAWLKDEPAPRMLLWALSYHGLKEVVGKGSNPEIMLMWRRLRQAGHGKVYGEFYTDDDIAWCGLFMADAALAAAKPVPRKFLGALEWAEWGNPVVGEPKLGDVLVFSRKGGGHVALYVGEDSECYHILGGNQGNSVSIVRRDKGTLVAARNLYTVGQPPNCRRVFLTATGGKSTNEA